MYAHHRHPVPMTALIFAYMETFGKALLIKELGATLEGKIKKDKNEVRKIVKQKMKQLVTDLELDDTNKYEQSFTESIMVRIYKPKYTSIQKVVKFIETYMNGLLNALNEKGKGFDSDVVIEKKNKECEKEKVGAILGDYYRNALVHQFWMKPGVCLVENTHGTSEYLVIDKELTNQKGGKKQVKFGINIDFLVPDFLNAINEYENRLTQDISERENLSKAVFAGT